MYNKISFIVRIYPEYEDTISFLFQNDENFRDLCSDYILCAAMTLEMRNDPNNYFIKIQEYEALQRELEEEIQQHILSEKKS